MTVPLIVAYTTVRVWFWRMLCLQEKLSTQTTVADFYSTIWVWQCSTNVFVYCKTISLSCFMTTLVVVIQTMSFSFCGNGSWKSWNNLSTHLFWTLVTFMCFQSRWNEYEATDFKTVWCGVVVKGDCLKIAYRWDALSGGLSKGS